MQNDYHGAKAENTEKTPEQGAILALERHVSGIAPNGFFRETMGKIAKELNRRYLK